MFLTHVNMDHFYSAVERVYHYAHNLEQEAPHEIDDKKPPDWPSRGDLVLDNISMCERYFYLLHLFLLQRC